MNSLLHSFSDHQDHLICPYVRPSTPKKHVKIIELDLYAADMDTVQLKAFSGLVYPHVQVLDLSYTGIDRLPDLRCFPELRILRCIGTKISFLSCTWPSTMEFVMLDKSSVRYVSKEHVPRCRLTLTDCKQLVRVPLTLCIQTVDIGESWFEAAPPRVQIERVVIEKMAAERIVRFLRYSRQRMRNIRQVLRRREINGNVVD